MSAIYTELYLNLCTPYLRCLTARMAQIFHALYHTEENVLLGAPTGSGKTISAELAILHAFATHPDRKVVYIAPMKVRPGFRVRVSYDSLTVKLNLEFTHTE